MLLCGDIIDCFSLLQACDGCWMMPFRLPEVVGLCGEGGILPAILTWLGHPALETVGACQSSCCWVRCKRNIYTERERAQQVAPAAHIQELPKAAIPLHKHYTAQLYQANRHRRVMCCLPPCCGLASPAANALRECWLGGRAGVCCCPLLAVVRQKLLLQAGRSCWQQKSATSNNQLCITILRAKHSCIA